MYTVFWFNKQNEFDIGPLDPDPLVRCMDPDPGPSIIKQTSKENL